MCNLFESVVDSWDRKDGITYRGQEFERVETYTLNSFTAMDADPHPNIEYGFWSILIICVDGFRPRQGQL